MSKINWDELKMLQTFVSSFIVACNNSIMDKNIVHPSVTCDQNICLNENLDVYCLANVEPICKRKNECMCKILCAIKHVHNFYKLQCTDF